MTRSKRKRKSAREIAKREGEAVGRMYLLSEMDTRAMVLRFYQAILEDRIERRKAKP